MISCRSAVVSAVASLAAAGMSMGCGASARTPVPLVVESPTPSASATPSVEAPPAPGETVSSDTPAANDEGAPSSDTAKEPSKDAVASDLLVEDEPIYLLGARARPKGSPVEVSHADELVATWNHGGTGEPSESGETKAPHAAPRIKVDVVEVRGDIREPDVQRAARAKSYWPFRICYEKGLRRTQRLHGKIQLQLTLGPSGSPTNVRPLSSEVGDAEVVRCIVKSASALGLPAPSSGMPQVKLDVSLWPGDEPIVSRAARGKTRLPEDKAPLETALRARHSDVRVCYGAGLKKHPLLWGRLALRVRVVGGRVTEAAEVESHFPDPDVTACVAKIFLESTLPAPDRELQFVYPLRLGRPPEGTSAAR